MMERFAHNFSCPPRRGDRYEAMGIAAVVVGVTFAGALTALPASASTTLLVSMTFAEPTVNLNHPCPVHGSGFCGSGHVTPFGQATETIEFGAGCGGSCDLRTIHLEDGTIVLEETLSDPLCPGSCQPNIAGPFSGTITDVIVDGTGLFEGATGELEGTVRAAGQQSRVKLSGFITFGP